jgi:hypothetical protein
MGGLGGGLRTIDWASQKLERFEKNFYVEDKRVSAMADRGVEDFRKSKEINVLVLNDILCSVHSRIHKISILDDIEYARGGPDP